MAHTLLAVTKPKIGRRERIRLHGEFLRQQWPNFGPGGHSQLSAAYAIKWLGEFSSDSENRGLRYQFSWYDNLPVIGFYLDGLRESSI